MITKPQNVFVLKDIMANGYRAGGNTKFFMPKGNFAAGVRAIQDRLNFDDMDSDYPSLLAFPMSDEQYQSGALDTVMSVTTRLLPYEVNSQSHDSFPGGPAMQSYYETALQLRQIHFGEDLRATENMEYMSQASASFETELYATPLHADSHPCFSLLCALRALPTTRCASSARRASSTRKAEPTPRSSPAWAIGVPTRDPATCAPIRPSNAVHFRASRAPPAHARILPCLLCPQARWRRGEAVSMMSAREAMLSYEQLSYLPKPRI